MVQSARIFLTKILIVVAGVALVLVVHNYGISLLPDQTRVIHPDEIHPDLPGPSFAYYVLFHEGVPDQVGDMRSRLRMFEDAELYTERTVGLGAIRSVGGGRFAHLKDRVLFATSNNLDPRTNGHIYRLKWPMLYSRGVGRASALVLAVSLLGLAALCRPAPAAMPAAPAPGGWSRRGHWLWWPAAVVFAAGLYCNTGTLAPYAVTYASYIDPATGHAYNQDHIHFRVLFDFVDGQPQAVWDKALLLRRILYPVICYPAMKLLGFAAGGVTMNLLLNLAAFIGAGWWLRKNTGERGAIFAGWLLALYPGFAYWVGMPYQYAIIGPGSILLTIALAKLGTADTWRRTLGWALLMGVVYLAYDFVAIFLPASLLLLVWRRRWRDTIIAGVAQVLPLLCWMLALRHVFHQSLENSNTSVYRGVIAGLTGVQDWGQWLVQRAGLWDTGAATFFGANFVFLPALFLGALAVNRWTSRVRIADSEWAVFGGALALFCLINVGEKGGGWAMSGSWISRLYQPVFPAMVFFLARWWQGLPPLPTGRRVLLYAGLGAALAGNGLVLFGPIFRNPLGVSDEVFYRFYTHSHADRSTVYVRMLHELPRQTFGFGRSQAKSGP